MVYCTIKAVIHKRRPKEGNQAGVHERQPRGLRAYKHTRSPLLLSFPLLSKVPGQCPCLIHAMQVSLLQNYILNPWLPQKLGFLLCFQCALPHTC